MQRLLKKCVYWVAAVLAKMAGGVDTRWESFFLFGGIGFFRVSNFYLNLLYLKKKKDFFFLLVVLLLPGTSIIPPIVSVRTGRCLTCTTVV